VLDEIARRSGTAVAYVKPHGALYNRAADDDEHALAVLDGSGDLPVLGLPGGRLLALAQERGRRVFHEGFADRAYVERPDGGLRLMPRDREGAVLHDPEEISSRAVDLATEVDSLCLHGDEPTAVAAAQAVRRALEDAGFEVRPFLGHAAGPL
jgi:UPF0271 protein